MTAQQSRDKRVMMADKSDIIARLRREILPLQGIPPARSDSLVNINLGIINESFPNHQFPTGVIHELLAAKKEDAACTAGFVAAILGSIMQVSGVCIWISSSRTLFPRALKTFGLDAGRIIFIDLPNQKQVLWAMEESLKCDSLHAVIGEINELDFTASRRLQLAVEKSKVTGFVLRNAPRTMNMTACVSRWKITALSSGVPDNLPGVGYPRWTVELLKIRNGKPGIWQLEWSAGRFRHLLAATHTRLIVQQKKAG